MEKEIEQVKTAADAESFDEYKAIRAAAVSPPPEPKAEEPAPEPEKAPEPVAEVAAGQSEEATGTSEPKTQEQEQEHKRRDRSAEGRISELTAARRRAEEEAADLRKRLEEYQATKPAAEKPRETPQAADLERKPKLKDFLDKEDISYEDAQEQYQDADYAWRERKRQREVQEQYAKEKVIAKVTAARAEFSDFDEVTHGDPRTGTGLILTPAMMDYVKESERSMPVMYYLGKNPEEYHAIRGISAVQQIAALARIEVALSAPSGNGHTQAPEKPKPPVSRAPAPPRIVGGVETAVKRDAAEASSYDEYRRIRLAQMKRA
jgi:hypothetical protein